MRGGAFAVVFSLLLAPAGAAAAFGGPAASPRPAPGAAPRLGAPQTPSAPAAIAGRVSWWKGEDNAVDSVGPNWGTNENGTTFVDGRVGRAFAFDGVDDRVMVPDDPSLALTTGVTIAAWLRMDACTHAFGWCAIVAKSIDGWAFNFNYGLIVSSAGRMSFIAGDGLAYILDYQGPDLRVGDWRHVAVTYDEATLSYFVDGTQIYSVAASVPLTANGAGLYLGGADDAGTVAAFDGDLDEVMLFDRALSAVEVAHLAATTAVLSEALSPSTEPGARTEQLALSGNGRYVAFASSAPNLVAGDINTDGEDLFVYDRQTGTTELVSVDSDEVQGPAGGSESPAISNDGRYVAFASWQWGLVGGDGNGLLDVFVRDRVAGTTERVSVDSSGNEADNQSLGISISSDGRYVTFWTMASNLVAGDGNGLWDLYRHDRDTDTTVRVSLSDGEAEPDAESPNPYVWPAAISSDGNLVAFRSEATNLVAGDANGVADIFLRDLAAGTTERVSVDSAEAEADGESLGVAISADGRYVAFGSWATDLVAGDTNDTPDVFVRDRLLGTTERVSVGSAGEQGWWSSDPSISADGRYVAFESDSFFPGDFGWQDVFVRDRQTSTTTWVSVDSAGNQAHGHAGRSSISADGRYVAFLSRAPDLAPGDTNGSLVDGGYLITRGALSGADAFVHDRDTGTTERAAAPAAAPPPGALELGDGSSVPGGPSGVSFDGRFVAFESLASNLVPGDTNGAGDVFVRDVATGAIERVSVDSAGNEADGRSSWASISADGRWVAFESVATDLVAGDSNGASDVFVHDRATGQTTRVSVDGSGGEGGSGSNSPSISGDGQLVAFYSWAELVAGDTNGTSDIFVRDRVALTTTRVSVDSSGTEGNNWCEAPAISADGRFVAFHSWADNLVASDSNGVADVFVHDRQTGTTTRVSVDSAGVEGDAGPWWYALPPAISPDGRYVAFDSAATNLVAGDTNGLPDVFLHDRQSGTTTRVSVDSAGNQGNLLSFSPSISADGRWIAFESRSSNLVPGDWWDTNDVFLHDTTTGVTILASLDAGGRQGYWSHDSYAPALSPNGACVAFASEVPYTALDVNGLSDLFLRCTLWPTLDIFSDDFESTNVAAWSSSTGYVP